MAKKVMGEDGKMYKVQKPFYKKIWFWILVVILVSGIASALGGDDSTNASKDSTPASSSKNEPTSESSVITEEEVIEESAEIETVKEVEPEPEEESKEESVSREHRNALRAAENYTSMMGFSKKGLFDQLTSEYGDGYPEESAQYAVDNLDVDWNEQALKSAINYLDVMPMSDSELYDQLISEYGDQYTAEQAQYALDNIPD